MDQQNLLTFIAGVDHRPLGDQGEDAYVYRFDGAGLHAQAVFDGCGGSGSWKHADYGNASSAFVAAQSMAAFCHRWVETILEAELADPPLLAERFRRESSAYLRQLKAQSAPMGVSGTMIKAFPCTASIALMEPRPGSLTLTALNAGDSRVYFLTPRHGLVQLTSDDSRGNPDPMRSLRESAVLSNILSADKDYKIRWRQVQLEGPCAVICATDGMFGFLRSPMDFEYLLLESLMKATSVEDFEARFKEQIVRVTGDDSTCVMAFYGFDSLENTQALLADRFHRVAEIIRALDEVKGNVQEMNAAIDQAWEAYKPAAMYGEWPQ